MSLQKFVFLTKQKYPEMKINRKKKQYIWARYTFLTKWESWKENVSLDRIGMLQVYIWAGLFSPYLLMGI